MDAKTTPRTDLELRAASGPTAVSFRLQPPGPLTIGRRSTNTLQLNDPAVSREQSRLSFRPAHWASDPSEGEWLLDDLGSTQGTWLNGVRLRLNRQYHLRAGDLIVIGPWTLLVADRTSPSRPETTLATIDDAGLVGTVLSRIEPATKETLSLQELQVLHRCSERIHTSRSEAEVAEAVLDVVTSGSGFTRAAFLRPMTDEDVVEVVAWREHDSAEHPAPKPSRSLIREAATGNSVCLRQAAATKADVSDRSGTGDVTALCVPITVESTLVGFIYLDRPVNDARRRQLAESARGVPLAAARLAAMGMANLMRIDIERRQERMEVELRAVAEAQRWLRPQREIQLGPFMCVGETRQGHRIGGDFFDIVPLDAQRIAVVFGDVGGTGIPVSILVSASQGFLHACLEEHGDPAVAVTRINRLYHSRIAHVSSLKLWLGIFDATKRLLTYVSAGHGYVMTGLAGGRWELQPPDDNLAVGVKPNVEYRAHTTALTPGMRTLIVSDGLVEQHAGEAQIEAADDTQSPGEADQPRRFGISGIQQCLREVPVGEDEIAALFCSLEEHAGTTVFDDDATAVMIRW